MPEARWSVQSLRKPDPSGAIVTWPDTEPLKYFDVAAFRPVRDVLAQCVADVHVLAGDPKGHRCILVAGREPPSVVARSAVRRGGPHR